MFNPNPVADSELHPESSVAARIRATLTRFGSRRHRHSSTGQPLVRLETRQLALLEMTFDGIFLVCGQGKVRRTNAIASEMFGESPQTIETVRNAARRVFDPLAVQALAFDSLCVFKQASDAERFTLLHRAAFAS